MGRVLLQLELETLRQELRASMGDVVRPRSREESALRGENRASAELRGAENTLPLFSVERSNKMGGDPNIRYYHSYWRVGPSEALLIEATPPPRCAGPPP